MASEIYYRENRRVGFRKWIESSKVGDSYKMEYDTGHKHQAFFGVKVSKKKVNIYNVSKWGYGSKSEGPVWVITNESIQWVHKETNSWSHGDSVRGFVRLGLFPRYDSEYRIESKEANYSSGSEKGKYALNNAEIDDADVNNLHKPLNGNGIGIRFLRKAFLLNLNGTEVVPFIGMKFDWNGNLLNRVSKKSKDMYNSCIKEDRDVITRQRRANAANVRIVRLLTKAKEANDYSKLKVNHIWYLTNVTNRTELINHFGMEKIIGELDYYVKHKNTINGNEYELLSVKIPDLTPNARESEREANYLKMINPTTGEIHIEGVANFVNDWSSDTPINSVGMALAWRNGDTDDWTNEDKTLVKSYIAEGSDIDTDLYAIPRTLT
jgi:hypothetical protein